MSFFSSQHYLKTTGSTVEQMQMKEQAPKVTVPESPIKKTAPKLPGILEVTPGSNAFAQHAARVDRHRLQGNAFYQELMRKQTEAPPAAIHPALRARSNSDPPTPPRASGCTTMSSLIGAAAEKRPSPPLKLVPSLTHLAMPTDRGFIEERQEMADFEQASERESERVPTTTRQISRHDFAKSTGASWKPTEQERGGGASSCHLPMHPKTPKKSLFEKLRITNLRTGNMASSQQALCSTDDAQSNMPVKAQAVLGASPSSRARSSLGSSPSKTSLPRSPSKRKGFFSRKNAPAIAEIDTVKATLSQTQNSADQQQPQTANTTIISTPHTAISDPTHYSYQGNGKSKHHCVSSWNSDYGMALQQDVVTCLRNSKHIDHQHPPTPPAKNTPPHEKKRKEEETVAREDSNRVPFSDCNLSSPKDLSRTLNEDDQHSPTRFGKHRNRAAPTLVTQPSMYSLHASVVPNMIDPSTFEDLKARVDGLGLEGFSMPPENVYSPRPEYTPSNYSTDWTNRRDAPFPATSLPLMYSQSSPIIHHAAAAGVPRRPHGPGGHAKSLSQGQPIYADLYNDLAISDKSPPRAKGQSPIRDDDDDDDERLIPSFAPNHLSLHAFPSPLPQTHPDLDEKASPAPNDDLTTQTSFSHQSAMVSPLHFLPPTIYSPPAKRSPGASAGQTDEAPPGAAADAHASDPLSPLERKQGQKKKKALQMGTGSPRSKKKKKEEEKFGGLKTATPRAAPEGTGAVPPPAAAAAAAAAAAVAGKGTSVLEGPNERWWRGGGGGDDPCPPTTAATTTSSSSSQDAKLDSMMDILHRLNARHEDVAAMKEEVRASTARLDERLAAMEAVVEHDAAAAAAAAAAKSSELLLSPAAEEGCAASAGGGVDELGVEEDGLRSLRLSRGEEQQQQEKRVSTNAAHEFYRAGQVFDQEVGGKGVDDDGGGQKTAESNATAAAAAAADREEKKEECEAIAGLKRTNEHLLLMMKEFSEQIKALEKKVAGK